MRCDNINLKVSTRNITKGESIRYAGRNITSNGLETATKDNQAIREFPEPTTRTELRGFIQLAENLAATAPSFKRNTEILRGLMIIQMEESPHNRIRQGQKDAHIRSGRTSVQQE